MSKDNPGPVAEQLACRFLLAQGLRLVERNWRCRYGEIDLIMWDQAVLVFVEVRLRTNSIFGGASASITFAKKSKLRTTAEHYLLKQKVLPACRFDAILFNALNLERVEWVKNIID